MPKSLPFRLGGELEIALDRPQKLISPMSEVGHQRLIDDVRFMSARRNFGHRCVAANVEKGQ